jgi:hypothetical protein
MTGRAARTRLAKPPVHLGGAAAGGSRPQKGCDAGRDRRAREESRHRGAGGSSLRFWHGERELLATAFPKEHSVRQAEVVESKRLSATIEFIKERQRERIERELRSRPRPCGRPACCAPERSGGALRTPPLRLNRDRLDRETGHFYFGENWTSVLWADKAESRQEAPHGGRGVSGDYVSHASAQRADLMPRVTGLHSAWIVSRS